MSIRGAATAVPRASARFAGPVPGGSLHSLPFASPPQRWAAPAPQFVHLRPRLAPALCVAVVLGFALIAVAGCASNRMHRGNVLKKWFCAPGACETIASALRIQPRPLPSRRTPRMVFPGLLLTDSSPAPRFVSVGRGETPGARTHGQDLHFFVHSGQWRHQRDV